jgi:phosphatidylglycerophosphate synthase
MECLVLADHPAASVKLCGISVLERSLRTLQACGFTRALILVDDDVATSALLRGFSPAWTRIAWRLHLRTNGPVTLEDRDVLVLRGDSVFDARLVRLLCMQDAPVAAVDSAPPANLLPLLDSAFMTDRGRFCGIALMSRELVSRGGAELDDAVRAGVNDGSLGAFDLAQHDWYSAELHRELRPYWFPSPPRARRQLAERVILDAAQKGTLDIPALVHAPIETFIVSKLCWTRLTPNQLTAFSNVVAWGATVLFATGRLGLGITVALIVGVLDGLDGKLARVKLQTSKAGRLEHLFDVLFENSWWIAIAYHLHVSGTLPSAYSYLALLVGAEVCNALARTSIVRFFGRSMAELAPFDRMFRLISGRRNIYVWILALGLIAGSPAKAFQLIAWWEAATAVVHWARAGWALSVRPTSVA